MLLIICKKKSFIFSFFYALNKNHLFIGFLFSFCPSCNLDQGIQAFMQALESPGEDEWVSKERKNFMGDKSNSKSYIKRGFLSFFVSFFISFRLCSFVYWIVFINLDLPPNSPFPSQALLCLKAFSPLIFFFCIHIHPCWCITYEMNKVLVMCYNFL